MLFFILIGALCLILYHLRYSLAVSLKSAAISINILCLSRCLDIFWASPFGKAVKIISTFFNLDLSNLIIFGSFFLIVLSKYEIFFPIDELPQRYLIVTL